MLFALVILMYPMKTEDVNVAYLTLNGKYKEELQANALLKYFEDFSTVILIVVEGLLLGTIDATKQLQSVVRTCS